MRELSLNYPIIMFDNQSYDCNKTTLGKCIRPPCGYVQELIHFGELHPPRSNENYWCNYTDFCPHRLRRGAGKLEAS